MVYSSSLRNKKGEAFGFWRNFGGTGSLSDQRMNRFDRARQAPGVMVWNVGGEARRWGGGCWPIGRSACPSMRADRDGVVGRSGDRRFRWHAGGPDAEFLKLS